MEGLYDIRSIIDENKNANEAANSAIRYLGPSQQWWKCYDNADKFFLN